MDQNIKKPKVSVLMPAYNSEAYLKEAIQGVLTQDFTDFEFIIVDDASNDKSSQVIKSFADNRIEFIQNAHNVGCIASLNEGMKKARGEYIARIDSDDIWIDKKKLSKQVAFLDTHPEYGLIGTYAHVIDDSGKTIAQMNFPTENTAIRNKMLVKNCIVNSSVTFRIKLWQSCGPYRSDELYAEDYGLWLRIGSVSKLVNIPEYCVAYRIHKNGATQKHNLKQTKTSLLVVQRNRKEYPNYALGLLKWRIKILLGSI
ncbi:MAG: glycosyltransferase [Candidatus Pacebacteria bacterium]|nr:glycosyltransferase [Candidatus Paceibacterota bacterium]MDD5356534.1 glycosyltransferase [Candidatus Paceibacterota bacterium]